MEFDPRVIGHWTIVVAAVSNSPTGVPTSALIRGLGDKATTLVRRVLDRVGRTHNADGVLVAASKAIALTVDWDNVSSATKTVSVRLTSVSVVNGSYSISASTHVCLASQLADVQALVTLSIFARAPVSLHKQVPRHKYAVATAVHGAYQRMCVNE